MQWKTNGDKSSVAIIFHTKTLNKTELIVFRNCISAQLILKDKFLIITILNRRLNLESYL